MSKDVTVHSYQHAGPTGEKPREPLVHLISTSEYGSVESITFRPEDAPAVADAILKAGRAAAANRPRKPITITFKEHD